MPERQRGSYHDVDFTATPTVGEVIAFLEQFDRDQEIDVYLDGEDRSRLSLHADNADDPEMVPTPMLVIENVWMERT